MKTRRDINIEENLRRWQLELDVFATMLKGLNKLKIKRIDLTGHNRNDHESELLTSGMYYLYCREGRWGLGTAFHMADRSWQISNGYLQFNLRHLDVVFEIELPIIPESPLGTLDVPDYDEDNNE